MRLLFYLIGQLDRSLRQCAEYCSWGEFSFTSMVFWSSFTSNVCQKV